MRKHAADVIWHGSPSQWVNANAFGFWAIFIVLNIVMQQQIAGWLMRMPGVGEKATLVQQIITVFPVLIMAWKWLVVHFHQYEMTEQVLRERYGIFNRQIHELELYRVRDTTTYRPFQLNIVGCGNVIMNTNDDSTPVAMISAIKNPDAVRTLLREKVEQARSNRGIVEIA